MKQRWMKMRRGDEKKDAKWKVVRESKKIYLQAGKNKKKMEDGTHNTIRGGRRRIAAEAAQGTSLNRTIECERRGEEDATREDDEDGRERERESKRCFPMTRDVPALDTWFQMKETRTKLKKNPKGRKKREREMTELMERKMKWSLIENKSRNMYYSEIWFYPRQRWQKVSIFLIFANLCLLNIRGSLNTLSLAEVIKKVLRQLRGQNKKFSSRLKGIEAFASNTHSPIWRSRKNTKSGNSKAAKERDVCHIGALDSGAKSWEEKLNE